MEQSFWRGHEIIWVNDKWLYVDTNEPTIGYGGKIRPCGACGKSFQGSNKGDPDPCLGTLPGVKNACCGHGIQSESYVQFENGVTLRGFKQDLEGFN